ncbi:MAG: GtrA family protein [Acidimicrobiales bacterium]
MPHSSDTPRGAGERVTLYDHLRNTTLVKAVLRWPAVDRVLSPTRGDRSVHRFIRYSLVSVVAIVISQVTILVCAWVFGLSGIVANTIGAVMATPASYQLNRKWAWGKSGKSHMWREVVPFWSLTLLGWLASTGTVEIADSMAKSHGVSGLGRAVAIMGASLFAYGVVWIVKFVIFNHIVFADRGAGAEMASGPAEAPMAGATASAPAAPPTAAGAVPMAVGPGAGRPAEPAWEGPARAGR